MLKHIVKVVLLDKARFLLSCSAVAEHLLGVCALLFR